VFQFAIPQCGFHKYYRFDLEAPAEGEPVSEEFRGPGGRLAVGLSFLYLYENPTNLATFGEWVCPVCEDRQSMASPACTLCGTVHQAAASTTTFAQVESLILQRLKQAGPSALQRSQLPQAQKWELGGDAGEAGDSFVGCNVASCPPQANHGWRFRGAEQDPSLGRRRPDPLALGVLPRILREGQAYVWKKRGLSGVWRSRWVVVLPDQLAVFRHKPGVAGGGAAAQEDKPNFIETFYFTADTRAAQRSALKRWSFEVFGVRPAKTLLIAAGGEKELLGWMAGIAAAVDVFRKRGGDASKEVRAGLARCR
jgi:hypothetical protein